MPMIAAGVGGPLAMGGISGGGVSCTWICCCVGATPPSSAGTAPSGTASPWGTPGDGAAARAGAGVAGRCWFGTNQPGFCWSCARTACGGTRKVSARAAPATECQELFTRPSYSLELGAEAEPEELRLVPGLLNHEWRHVNVNQPERTTPGDADTGAQP